MKYQGKSKPTGAIIEGTLMIEGLETWIATDTGRTAVWPDSVEEVKSNDDDINIRRDCCLTSAAAPDDWDFDDEVKNE